MTFETFVEWLFKNTHIALNLDHLHTTRTENTYIISRLTGLEDNPDFDTFISVTRDGNFVTTNVYLDKQQDQKLVSKLNKEYKQQLKAMFGGVKISFIESTADEKSKTIFESSPKEVIDFFMEYNDDFVWQLPLKKKKVKA